MEKGKDVVVPGLSAAALSGPGLSGNHGGRCSKVGPPSTVRPDSREAAEGRCAVPCLSVAASSGRRVSEERRDVAEGVDQRVCQLSRGKHMDVLSLRCCFAKQGAVGTQTLSNRMCEVPHVIHKGSRMVHAKEALELWDYVRMAPDGKSKGPDS